MTVRWRATAVRREMLRDLVECHEFSSLCLALGMVPAGPEVDASEHAASHERIAAVRPIFDHLCEAADIAADVLLRLASLGSPEQPDGEDYEHYRALCRTASMAVITHLASDGALEVTR